METLVRSTKAGWMLMGLGLLCWALASWSINSSWEWRGATAHFVGALAFFSIACFLPEYRRMRLLSRKSALKLSVLFVFLGLREAQETESAREFLRMSNANIDESEQLVSFVATVVLYYLFVFLIRSFRGGTRYEDAVGMPAAGPSAAARRGKRLVTGHSHFPR